MPPKIDWESQVGRRFKLRDLHVFFTVVQCGSMAKAARELGVSQPAVSEVIADLEHAVGTRLLDRLPQGVEPTIYGRALLKRSIAVFDELKQSIRDIEFLSDPTCGELRFGCSGSIAAILSPVVERFCTTYPQVVVQLNDVRPPRERQMEELRDRKLDLTVSRVLAASPADAAAEDDLNVEQLFNDRLVVATGKRSPFASRRKVEPAELVHESWLLAGGDSWADVSMANLFQSNGLPMPRISVLTYAVPLRIDLLTTGKFVAALPKSIADRYALKVLPIEIPEQPWMVAIMTLKNRTLSPVAEKFIEHLRDFGRTMRASEPARRRRKPLLPLRL